MKHNRTNIGLWNFIRSWQILENNYKVLSFLAFLNFRDFFDVFLNFFGVYKVSLRILLRQNVSRLKKMGKYNEF